MQRVSLWLLIHTSTSFGDVVDKLVDEPGPVKVVNLETITDMQSWCRTWPLNGSSRIRAKHKFHKKPREVCKSSWNLRGNPKSSTLTIPWNSEKLVKILHGIVVRRHHTYQKQTGLLKVFV